MGPAISACAPPGRFLFSQMTGSKDLPCEHLKCAQRRSIEPEDTATRTDWRGGRGRKCEYAQDLAPNDDTGNASHGIGQISNQHSPED